MLNAESQAIGWLRFPMAIAVIFIHSGAKVVAPMQYEYSLYSMIGILNFLKVLFVHTMPSIVVPLFFMFSSWLLYRDVKSVNIVWYKERMYKRVKSLLVPYFLWNILAILPMCFFMHNSNLIEDFGTGSWSNLLSVFWAYRGPFPLDFPLWFIRDLIILNLVSPLLLCYVRKLDRWGILPLVLLFLFDVIPDLPGFSMKSLYAYTLGIYFSQRGRIAMRGTILSCCIVLSIIILLCATIFLEIKFLKNLYIVIGMVSLFEVTVYLVDKNKLFKIPKLFSSASLFIFASHALCIYGYSTAIMRIIIPFNGVICEFIQFLLSPLLASLVCVLIYYICKRIVPLLLSLLMGGRV